MTIYADWNIGGTFWLNKGGLCRIVRSHNLIKLPWQGKTLCHVPSGSFVIYLETHDRWVKVIYGATVGWFLLSGEEELEVARETGLAPVK